MWQAASFYNNGYIISRKTQSERWMDTGRSIWDIIFFENIVKRTLENPCSLAENPLENPGKEFHFTVGHPVEFCQCQAETFGTLKNLVCTVRSTRKIFAAYLFWSGDLLLCPWSFHFVFIFNFINFYTRETLRGIPTTNY